MTHRLRFFCIILGSLAITGCSVGPTAEQLSNADFGPPPSGDYKAQIRSTFDLILFDGASARYRFERPVKSYLKAAPVYGTSLTYGWRVCGLVNAKNRFGGYVGWRRFFTLFNHNAIVFRIMGGDEDLNDASIASACARTV
jgi:hypothetical protein